MHWQYSLIFLILAVSLAVVGLLWNHFLGYLLWWNAALSFLLFNLLNIPCMAAVSALRGEMNSAKWSWFAIGYWFSVAWIVSFTVFQVGRLLGF